MGAPTRVEWTPEAKAQLQHIHAFVLEQWSAQVADRFLDLVFEFEDLIVRYPRIYRASPMHPELRLGWIHRNVKAIYRIDPDRTLIVALLDNRAENGRWF